MDLIGLPSADFEKDWDAFTAMPEAAQAPTVQTQNEPAQPASSRSALSVDAEDLKSYERLGDALQKNFDRFDNDVTALPVPRVPGRSLPAQSEPAQQWNGRSELPLGAEEQERYEHLGDTLKKNFARFGNDLTAMEFPNFTDWIGEQRRNGRSDQRENEDRDKEVEEVAK